MNNTIDKALEMAMKYKNNIYILTLPEWEGKKWSYQKKLNQLLKRKLSKTTRNGIIRGSKINTLW